MLRRCVLESVQRSLLLTDSFPVHCLTSVLTRRCQLCGEIADSCSCGLHYDKANLRGPALAAGGVMMQFMVGDEGPSEVAQLAAFLSWYA